MSTATALAAPDVLDCGPDEKSSAQWQTRLAALVSRGAGRDDPRAAQCRSALAFWRVAKIVAAQADDLDQAGRDLLISALRGAS